MLGEQLKKEIDQLSNEQLKKIVDVIGWIEFQTDRRSRVTPLWQRITPEERARDFRDWVSQLPKNSPSLSDIAFR